ncbi:SRPBCC family protein [Dactylosporangium sp. CA-092794]|uniref:SRPBCC family protein n=1 Tax=Dactylosporangium sp. CA-092794 TaxID=3239929 RepID=UPI003D91A4B6
MIETVEAVRREVVVGAGRERAFEIFTADMTSWWPGSHHIGDAPIERVIIEPRSGGRWYTVHQDGSETCTGVVAVWDPPARLVVTWQIGADWKYHDDLVTTVDVRFEEVAPGRTRVRLEHRDLAAFGADAAKMRETFEQPGAWTGILETFARVAGQPA